MNGPEGPSGAGTSIATPPALQVFGGSMYTRVLEGQVPPVSDSSITVTLARSLDGGATPPSGERSIYGIQGRGGSIYRIVVARGLQESWQVERALRQCGLLKQPDRAGYRAVFGPP
jgi:hypothetical protein